jgi:hypothetical protein
VNIDEHIVQALTATGGRSLSVGDLARHLGIGPNIVLPAAHRLVDGGLVSPLYADVHGVPTLRGLAALPAADTSSD